MAAYNPNELRKKEEQDPRGIYDASGISKTEAPGSAPPKDELNNLEANAGESAAASSNTVSSGGRGSFYRGRGDRQPLSARLKNLSARRKAAISAAIVTAILGVLGALFFSSSIELLQFKHLLTDKISMSENHTISVGQKKIYSTEFFFDKNGNFAGDKVGGIRRLMAENRKTKAMVNDLSDNGYKVVFGSDGKIKALQKVNKNGEVIASYDSNSAAERAWSIKNSGDLNNILKEIYPDKSSFWYSRSTAKLYRRWGLTRSDWLRDQFKKGTGVTALENMELKFRQALREKMFGPSSGRQGNIQADSSRKKPDPKDANGAIEQSAAALSDGVFADANSSAQAEAQKLLSDPSYTGASSILDASSGLASEAALKSATEGTLKNVLSAKAFNLLNADQNACVANKALGDVVVGARVLRAAQLMNFALSIMNIADAVQNGQGVSSQEVDALMQYLNSTDKNGKNIFESSGWKYWMDPKAKGLFSSYDQNQRDQYSVGGGFTGTLASIKYSIDKYGGGTNCNLVNNPFISWGALGVSIGLGIISGGTITGADVAFNTAVGFATQYAVAVVTQLVTPMVGGYVINGAEQGTGVGNALVSGMEVLASVNGTNSGMRPLTTSEYRSQIAAIQQDQEQQLSQTPILARLFSPNQDSSLTNDAAVGLASLHTSSIFGSLSHLGDLFHFGNLLGQPALAASGTCPDGDITSNHLAATPFCNTISGIPDSVMNNPAYAPDVVDQKMSCLDNSGNTIAGCTPQVDTDGNPLSGTDYEKYINQCTSANKTTAGLDVIHNDSSDQKEYTNICSSDLYNTYTLYLNLAQTDNDVLTGNLAAESSGGSYTAAPTTSNQNTSSSDNSGTVTGNAQQLATQILAQVKAGKITLDHEWDQLGDAASGSAPQQNLEETAAGQPAKTTPNCGGRGAQAPNPTANLNPNLLQFILSLSQVSSFQINALAGECHSSTASDHYKGMAVDFGCPFDAATADKLGAKYGVSDGTGETCSNAGHYHYSTDGH